MNIRIYLVSVDGLEDSRCYDMALSCVDQTRYKKVCSYKRQKDQCLAVATGLLLQVAYQQLLQGYSVDEKINIYTIKNLLEVVGASKKEIIYDINEFGKPYWNCENKNYQFFSVSHSGEYVMLACSDVEIGVDFQYEKQTKYMKHSVSTFSKCEAYVKCMGSGFSGEGARVLDYLLHAQTEEKNYYGGNMNFYPLDIMKEYIAWICVRKTF